MRKILSIFAAMLVAVAVNAQTDFASPGYYCAADDAVLTGGSSTNFYLDQTLDPHQVTWSDVGTSSNALATWTVTATRGCYVSVSLDLGPVISSNKHIFEVKILDANANLRGTVAEPAENADADQVKALDGTILLPTAGVYTVELRNNRNWGKGRIKNVILTYAADAPSEIIAVTSVELNKNEVTLDLEEVELLTATVSPDDATDPSVTWESSDPAVATVSENGLVTAITAGTANITATAGEQSATCAVTVAAAAVPDVDFSEPYLLAAKVAHLEGAIWKNENYKLYGDGGHNKNYGTASWTIHVTRPCVVSGVLKGVEGGHIFGMDLYQGESLLGSIEQTEGSTWWAGDIGMDGTLTFAAVGDYTLKLRNTQEWSSGKAAGVMLTFVEEYVPAEPKTIYFKVTADWWNWDYDNHTTVYAYAWVDDVTHNADWPGEPMTAVENENDIWSIEIGGQFTHIMFMRMSQAGEYKSVKTADLTIPTDDNNMYIVTKESRDWSTDPEQMLDTDGEWGVFVPTVLENITYYYVNALDWQTVYAYAWDPVIANWPGEEATLQLGVDVDGHNIWAYTMPSNRRYIVFNDGTSGAGHQTDDLAVEDGKPFFYNGTWYASLDEIATAITNINAASQVEKMIENGQLLIIKNGVKYNAQGTMVK